MYLQQLYSYLSLLLTITALILSSFKLLKKKRIQQIPNQNCSLNSLKPPNPTTSGGEGEYDVFLSFRGEDTRKGFIDFLYTYLVGASIHTFRDDNELRIGEEIGPDLLKSIEDSKILIPVFSENYAYSKWCLSELSHMVKCHKYAGRKIFPVFYNVQVSDVKNQKGSYDKAFRWHQKNFDKQTVQDWREALKTVGKLKGYELKNETNGYEGELVKKLVEVVLLELKKNYTHVPELVGMDDHVREMTRLLQVDSECARIVGIHGMGGIGKTTIAKVIYNKLCDSFDGCCFLEDVRERAKQHPNGLVDLQKQLVSKILKNDFPDIVDVDDGINKIKVIHRKKVFIVLDNVDKKSHFDTLAGECSWFDKGSKIIVTTRNKEVLNAIEATCHGKGLIEGYRCYEPELMSDGDSLKLFSKHAFMKDSPPKDYFMLSQKATFFAARLPLVLVTLGSLFLGIRDKASWRSKLEKLKKVPHEDVMGKLRISFDELDDDNKNIFLDIACLFIGKDYTVPCYMWEVCEFVPEDGINTLVLRSLVKVREDNKLGMHDQLRDLGRQIVREEYLYKFSRVWYPKEALKVLDRGLGVENVEALNLDLIELELNEYEQLVCENKEQEQMNIAGKGYYVECLKGQSFNRLQSLRFLRLGCVILDKDFSNLFPNLLWLEWRMYKEFMPTNLNLKNLVILDLSNSTITDEWQGWALFKVAKKLKVLNLYGCMGLVRGPNLFSFAALEVLNLGHTSLEEINPSLGNHVTLRSLDLSSCNLQNFDCSTFSNLENLSLNSCKSLMEVSGFEQLESLTSLNMNGCISIIKLLDLSKLKMLKKLLLNDCSNLYQIKGLDELVSLEHLEMTSCEAIENLPTLSKLRVLKKLVLNGCSKLQSIEGLCGLVSLEVLDMAICESMERLPELSKLKMLKKLVLNFCSKLYEVEGLGGLVSLEHLDMVSCVSINRLPELSSLRKLKTLSLDFCIKLLEVVGLEGLISLEQFTMSGCYSMKRLLGISGLVSLENMDLSYCTSMDTLNFAYLVNLKKLNLEGLTHWTEIRGIKKLKSLQMLNMYNCNKVKMPGGNWQPINSKVTNAKGRVMIGRPILKPNQLKDSPNYKKMIEEYIHNINLKYEPME